MASAGKIGGDIVGTSLLEWYLQRKVIVFCSVSSKFVSPLITSHFCVSSTFVLDNHQMDWKWRQKGIRHEPHKEVIYSQWFPVSHHLDTDLTGSFTPPSRNKRFVQAWRMLLNTIVPYDETLTSVRIMRVPFLRE